MESLRTTTVTTSPLFRDIVAQSFSRFFEIDIVGDLETRADLERRLPAIAPSLLFIGLNKNEDDAIVFSLAKLLPQAVVVGFSSDLRRAVVHRARRGPIALDNASLEALVDAIDTFRS